MGHRIGIDAVLNYKVGGQSAAGAWTPLGNVKDLTLNLEASEADVTTRANGGWRATVPTLKDASLDFEMVWDTEDAGFEAIQNAFLSGSKIGFQALDGTGGKGIQGDFAIFSFSRAEALEEALMVSVTAKITYSTTPPAQVGYGAAVSGA